MCGLEAVSFKKKKKGVTMGLSMASPPRCIFWTLVNNQIPRSSLLITEIETIHPDDKLSEFFTPHLYLLLVPQRQNKNVSC